MDTYSDYPVTEGPFYIAFENGLLYALRYMEHEDILEVTDGDIYRLSAHLAETKTWRDVDGWQEFITVNLRRWKRVKRERSEHEFDYHLLSDINCGGDYPPAVL